ncbi:PREDICTED: pentatricopeptide repeat-containing protein At2g17210-like [Camelina sativa]|uniref:Pentatricopeptide repeat-containing protein At2g17210-like n=1 Tax=Camelina sativa TaxID=90675 RepID=A0ABM0W937_CAMSA|nr:PREDICTED: pentatricopeptide repeat-containing protein At2g17210-like [Camelina sativa]
MGTHLCSKLEALSSKIKQASVNGRWREVLTGYSEIHRAGIQFNDPFVFPIVFKACAKLSWLFQGKCIQASLLKRGFESFVSVGNSIADFYLKCGDLSSAIREFDCMTWRDSISWNVIVFGLLDHGFEEEGLRWFSTSRVWGFEPNVSTLVLVIHASRSLRLDGEEVHGYVIRSGFCGIPSVQNSILCRYSECDPSSARKLFDEMSERDVISWSVVIRSYVQSQEPVLGLKLFKEMVREAKTEPDCVTVTSVLKACAVLEDIDVGRSVHGFSIQRGFDLVDVFVRNSLIDMYSKGFDVDSAFRVFDETTCRNIVSWNSILAGFVHNQRYDEAVEMFRLMVKEAVEVDEVTLVTLLQVCKFFEQPLPCKSIHCVMIRHGYESNEVALSSLIDAYTSCSLVDDARTVLDLMIYKDVVSCSILISGLARSGRPYEAISIFCQMKDKPNGITVINLLNACSVSADLRKSKWGHGIAIRRGLAISDISVDTSIVDAYAKCGAIDMARRAFDQIPSKNVVSWTVIISAYAINGLPEKALASFEEMKQKGYTPNDVTYLAALSACNHGGLVEKGLMVLKSMVENDHKPSLQHYSCIVDMLSRAGEIDTAMELIKNLPEDVKAGASAWGAILSGCRNHLKKGIITLEAAAEVLELEPLCSSGYLLASSAFAAEKSWEDVAIMRRLVKERKVRVVAGYSMVLEGSSIARRFLAGDKLSQSDSELNDVVQSLHRYMRLDDTTERRNIGPLGLCD